ncbi:amino acid permease [Pseudonocardia thermophila]|uniref:amino acid permease n=1 Tax=Pseudonocardia thermophila TaxID=1848 RepID=UPI00248DDA16|nr:amino acid permease [Pseudonocardia thermophila]
MGYPRTLHRGFGGFANFAIPFMVVSVLAGCLTSYHVALANGGPVVITWGWLLVSAFYGVVAMALTEIASAIPTAGALHYWAAKLGGRAWGWFTGWFNLIGLVALTAAACHGAAISTTALLNLGFPGAVGTDGPTISSSAR